MRTNQPTAPFLFLKLSLFGLIFLSLFACNNDPYKDVIDLIPKDTPDKKAYLMKSINYFNDVNDALNVKIDSQRGRSISPALAKILHDNYNENRTMEGDSIRAITFSYSKILQSIKNAEFIDFDKVEVTVMFARFPKTIAENYLNEMGIDANTYGSQIANNLTCVLTYRTPGVESKLRFYQFPPGQYDEIGAPCPSYCEHESNN
ncbi:MAG: hypothetical protein IPJ13_13350 [Saprospiraceae bacterium]|nr:hypothetical protein [Saprospiraceae bacterium]